MAPAGPPHPDRRCQKTGVSADFVGAIRTEIKEQTGAKFICFQGAAGNVNTTSRLDDVNHGLIYTAYGQAVASQILEQLSTLSDRTPGSLQVDNYSYMAIVDRPTEETYTQAKADLAALEEAVGTGTVQEQNEYARSLGYTSVYAMRRIIDGTVGLVLRTKSNCLAQQGLLGLSSVHMMFYKALSPAHHSVPIG